MKYCPKCDTIKKLYLFYKRKTGIKAGKYYEKCKQCMKDRGRLYYSQNRTRQLNLSLKRKNRMVKEKRKFLIAYKDQPCQDCGNKYSPYAMDFDHRDPKEKTAEIARMVSWNLSLQKIKKEIRKM